MDDPKSNFVAAVIQKECYRVSRKDALGYVFGYMGLMDITVRGDGDRSRRKSYKSFTPIGPWITTADEIPDPQNVAVKLSVNGQLRQDSNTKNMVFGVAYLVSYLSQYLTLEPGDVISTGTPEGVGHGRVPPVYLAHGDVVEVEVEGIGVLRNPCTVVG